MTSSQRSINLKEKNLKRYENVANNLLLNAYNEKIQHLEKLRIKEVRTKFISENYDKERRKDSKKTKKLRKKEMEVLQKKRQMDEVVEN